MIGSAGVANALSHYIDSLTDGKIKHALLKAMPIKLLGLGPYADVLAFGLVLVAICELFSVFC